MPSSLAGTKSLDALMAVAMTEFQKVWQRIGISGEAQATRQEVVLNYTQKLLDDMLEEELALEVKLKSDVKTFSSQLEKLSTELDIPVPKLDESMALLVAEETLRKQVKELEREKKERRSLLESLLQKDQLLCAELVTGSFQIKKHSTPSPQQLQLFQQHIHDLETEKNKRQLRFTEMQRCIVSLLEQLELSPNTSFERSVICDSDEVPLNLNNLRATEKYMTELESVEGQNRKEIEGMWKRVKELWSRLGVVEEETREVEEQHQGVSQRVILSLADELSRLEELRLQNMRVFVTEVRAELEALWNECFVPSHVRDEFTPFFAEEMSEELLLQHEEEVKRMQQYRHDNHEMLSLVAKQQKLWNEHVELEQRASHVSTERYCNRGGQLLKEEKMRKKIKIELPRVEEEVFGLIEAWEQRNGRVFLVGGLSFRDFMRKQKDDWATEKENHKILKQQQRARQMEEELMYGSKPATPGSKRFANTPTKTPNKSRKLDTPSSSRLHFRRPLASPIPSASKLRDKTGLSRIHSGCSTDTPSSTTDHFKPPIERSGSLQVLTPKTDNKKNREGSRKVNLGSNVELRGSFKNLNNNLIHKPFYNSNNNLNKFNSNTNLNKFNSNTNLNKFNSNTNLNKFNSNNDDKHNNNDKKHNNDNITVIAPPLADTTITLHPVGHYEDFANDINKVCKNKARSTLAPTFI